MFTSSYDGPLVGFATFTVRNAGRHTGFVAAEGRAFDAPAPAAARPDRPLRPALGRGGPVSNGQGKGSQAQPRHGVPHPQAAQGERFGGRTGPGPLPRRPTLL